MGKSRTEIIVFNDKKWLNEKHIEEQLGRSDLHKTTSKYPLEFRKQRQELLKNCSKRACRRFMKENLALHLIMDYRTVKAVEYRSKLGFNQQDPFMCQEQSILSKSN